MCAPTSHRQLRGASDAGPDLGFLFLARSSNALGPLELDGNPPPAGARGSGAESARTTFRRDARADTQGSCLAPRLVSLGRSCVCAGALAGIVKVAVTPPAPET